MIKYRADKRRNILGKATSTVNSTFNCYKAQTYIETVILYFIDYKPDKTSGEEYLQYSLGPYEEDIVRLMKERALPRIRESKAGLSGSEYGEILTDIQNEIFKIGKKSIPLYTYSNKYYMVPPLVGRFSKIWKNEIHSKFNECSIQRYFMSNNMMGSAEQINEQLFPIESSPLEGTIEEFKTWLYLYVNKILNVEELFVEYTIGDRDRTLQMEQLFRDRNIDICWIDKSSEEDLHKLYKHVAKIITTVGSADGNRRLTEERRMHKQRKRKKHSSRRKSYADIIAMETGVVESEDCDLFITKYIARKLSEVYKPESIEGKLLVGHQTSKNLLQLSR